MPLIVLTLSFLCFIAYVNSQSCVEESLDCNKAVPTLFKLSDASCSCDDASHSGALKFADNEVHVCVGTEWKEVLLMKEASGPYGSEGNPGQSCDDIYEELVKDAMPKDGIYWLRISPANGEAFPVYCDMKNQGWTMVFKAVSGITMLPWTVLSSEFTSGETDKKGLDLTNNFQKHYKSRIVMFWEKFGPTQARVSFHKGGSMRKSLVFNAQNSNYFNWFTQGKLTHSSWNDLALAKDIGVFSLQGYCSPPPVICQNFHVVRTVQNLTCETVVGWMYRGSYTHCSWEAANHHKIAYCKGITSCNFSEQDKVEAADVVAIFVTKRK